VFALGLVGVAAIGVADEVTGAEIHLTLLYILAVAFGSWFLGAGGGLGLALASAVAWWAADVATRAYDPPMRVQMFNFAMELAVFAGSAVLLASLRARIGREHALARTDALTGLLNRRGFLEIARREIARSERTSSPLTVALVDVDGFKEVNDTRGHEAGDHLLGGLATALQSAMRTVDACARLGGDEFAVVLPDTDPASVEVVLDGSASSSFRPRRRRAHRSRSAWAPPPSSAHPSASTRCSAPPTACCTTSSRTAATACGTI
jgi:GGDEF domain-containing protein